METKDEQKGRNGIPHPDTAHAAQNDSVKTPGNQSFEHSGHDPNSHAGSQALSEHYNINDKAHHDSSVNDFVKTVSNYHHAEPHNNNDQNHVDDDSRDHS